MWQKGCADMSEILLPDQFCITVEYDQNASNPEKIFQSIAKTIEGFQAIDSQLVTCISSNIEPLILLEDIEHGSLKTYLKSFIKSLPDDGLKECNLKRIIGEYLVRGKYIILAALEGKDEIEKNEVITLEQRLYQEAKNTGVSQLDCYSRPNRKMLLEGIGTLSTGISLLRDSDHMYLETNKEKIVVNKFNMFPEQIEELCVGKKVENENELILKLKEVDFLGESQWTFRHGAQTIKAKIMDEEWLKKYHNREVVLVPGDSLRVKIKTQTYYDENGFFIKSNSQIMKVIEVVKIDDFMPNELINEKM